MTRRWRGYCREVFLPGADAADLRDPPSALTFVTRANKLTEHADPEFLGTLAEAQHATRDANAAIETLGKALALLEEDAPSRTDLERLRDEYQAD